MLLRVIVVSGHICSPSHCMMITSHITSTAKLLLCSKLLIRMGWSLPLVRWVVHTCHARCDRGVGVNREARWREDTELFDGKLGKHQKLLKRTYRQVFEWLWAWGLIFILPIWSFLFEATLLRWRRHLRSRGSSENYWWILAQLRWIGFWRIETSLHGGCTLRPRAVMVCVDCRRSS